MAPKILLQILEKAPSGRFFYSLFFALLAIVALVTSWLAPSHYLPWIVFENEFLAFLAIAFAATALILNGWVDIRFNYYLYLGTFVVVAVFVQWSIGMISTQVASLGCLYIVAFACAAVAGQQCRNVCCDGFPEFYVYLLLLILAGILTSACIVFAQWAGVEKNFPMFMAEMGAYRPFGNLGQPNNQATLLVSGMIVVDLLWRRGSLTLAVAIFFMVILVMAIAMTGSRTAVLGGVIAAFFLFFHSKKTRNRIFTIGWVLAIPVAYAVIPWMKKYLFFSIDTEGVRALEKIAESPRMSIYIQLIKVIPENLWMGYGWMQTGFAQSQSALNNFAGFETHYAHNFVLDQILWFGLPLAIILISATLYALIKNYCNGKAAKKIGYALLVPFGVHCMLEFPFAYAYFLLPTGFLLGYLHGDAVFNNPIWRPTERLTQALFVSHFAALVVLGALITIDYLMLAEDFRVLRFSSKNIGKIPEHFHITEPILLNDMRNSFDVFGYTPNAKVTSAMMEKIKYAAMHEHWPSANVKLISIQMIVGNQAEALSEYHRFRNLYGEQIVKWGADALFNAHCSAEIRSEKNDVICLTLQADVEKNTR